MTVDRLAPWATPEPSLRWPQDGLVFLVTSLYVTLFGAVTGLVWAAVAPKLSVAGVVAGHESPFRAQIGADVWFLLVGASAGVLTAAVALLLGADGPSASAGLGVGGFAAAFVADRVGWLTQHGDLLDALRALQLDPAHINLGLLDFRVRALGVLVAWPLAAIVVHTCAVAVRGRWR